MNLNSELNIEKNNNQNLSQRIKELEKIINIKGGQNLIDKSKNRKNYFIIAFLIILLKDYLIFTY